jgi:DNA-binding CsgD family transcriptional regulator
MFVSALGEQILELHRQGVPSLDIAHRLNVAQATIHYHVRKMRREAADTGRPMSRSIPKNARFTVDTRERVAALLAQGVSRVEIARRLRISKQTVSYHARRLGARIDERFARRYDWKIIQEFYDQGHSVRDCIREFGFSSQTWHQAALRGLVTPRPAFTPHEEFFALGKPRNRGHAKQRLLRLGLKENRCERCGIAEWQGSLLSLSLHHVNGQRDDNRIENLQLLCPNCHSQTENYSGRNGRAGQSGGLGTRLDPS